MGNNMRVARVSFSTIKSRTTFAPTHPGRRSRRRTHSTRHMAAPWSWSFRRGGVGRDPEAKAGIAARLKRWLTIDELIASPEIRDTLVGEGCAWVSMLRDVVEFARFTDASLLITGESGTGKELVARLIHALDPLRRKRLVLLDCSTVVPELSGSEFFGHERGAFTTAVAEREGAFALADGGTLFLDEVGELPLRLQAELLRVVQERTYKRIGSNTWKETNFRLICATNRDLREEKARGAFRADFYHRLAAGILELRALGAEDVVIRLRFPFVFIL